VSGVPHDALAQFTTHVLPRSAVIHFAARPHFVEPVNG
jgi:hypothetical protein